MAVKIRIFVEGIADKKFISDYLTYLNEIYPDNFDIIDTDGWNNLPKLENKFKENTNDNGKNIVIFDANQNPEQRRTDILNYIDRL